MRTFDTGATRDSNDNKLAYDGFLSPVALRRFALYMHHHRLQPDGTLRDAGNWKKGIPLDSYKESLIRHVMDFWEFAENGELEAADEAACAILFNVQGWLHERNK